MNINKESLQGKLFELKGDFFVWVIFTLAAYRFFYNFSNAIDLAIWDEVYYLSGAKSFSLNKILPNANWAPLYTLWYYAISILNPEPVHMYYLNMAVITFLLPLSIIFTALKFKIPPPLALILGLLVLTGYLNLEVSPKPAHLALAVLVWVIGLSRHTSKIQFKLGIFCVGSFIASYLRPEFFLSFLLLSMLFLGYTLLKLKELSKNEIVKILLSVSIIGIIIFFLGIPFINSDNRSMMAFGQHFALNWTGWTHSNLNPQLNWELILKRNFGDANSFLELLLRNPSMFTRHIFSNAIEFGKDIRFVFYHYPLFVSTALMATVGLATLFLFMIFITFRFKHLKSNVLMFKWETIAIGIIMMPSIISCILIFPRLHYVLIIAVLSVLWLTVLSAHEMNWTGCVPSIILPLTLALWIPNAAESIKPSLKNKNSLDFIKDHQHGSIKLLESGAGIGFYFEHVERYSLADIQNSMVPSNFISHNKINVVFVDYFFDKQPVFSSQKLWKNWINQDYLSDGFKKYVIKGNLVYIK